MTPSQQFTYTRTYSRWIEALKRREQYPESVERAMTFFQSELGDIITPHFYKMGHQAMSNQDALCSMRAMWAAGDAAKNNHISLYNCSYVTLSDIQAFSEILFILMCGTGVGFSIERQYIDRLPVIESKSSRKVNIVVEDSREGWARGLDEYIRASWTGFDITVDTSKIRPRGARLITMGGRASGPEPLIALFSFISDLFQTKRKRGQAKLYPIDALDICNKIAEIVVVGGVRRSSEISLSDLEDTQVARAKMGRFYEDFPHRGMSNNSTAYNVKPDILSFWEEFGSLIKSGSGERGIFNREGARKQLTASGRRKDDKDVGTNPCGEILLRDMEFCNLSEVIVRANDNRQSLRAKVKVAAMFGAWQASFTEFPYLRPEWKKNCDEERLLGVSLTGIMDNPVLNNVNDRMKRWLGELKSLAIEETERWCEKLKINMSAAVTCVKPSGTVSQLVNCSSGIHPRYSDYYIRRYRISATDPLFRMLRDQGVPLSPEVGQETGTASTFVLDFPIASPRGSKTRHDFRALQQLEHWKTIKEFWTEHNPSITVYVGEDEWLDTGAWCYRNFDDLCGVSFLPRSQHVYQLAPYEEITKSRYDELQKGFPQIDYGQLSQYEQEDNTEGSKTYSCVGDKCEII